MAIFLPSIFSDPWSNAGNPSLLLVSLFMYLRENNSKDMKKLSSVILTVIFVVSGLVAQREETLFGESGLKLTGAWGGPRYGVSFLDGNAIGTRGGFIGVEFNKLLYVGIGNVETYGSVQLKSTVNEEYKFKHGGLFVGYHPNQFKVVHPVFGFMLGGGELKNSNGKKDDLFAVQPSGGVEVNIFKWWKVSAEGGYRFVSGVNSPNLSDTDLSSFFLDFKFRFGWSW